MFRYYLNSIQVNEPSNWKDFEEGIEYDLENNTFLYNYSTLLKFNGGRAYDELLFQWENNTCSYIPFSIEQKICGEWKTVFIGNVFVADIVLNTNLCTVECNVTDNGYLALINNNKSIEIYIDETSAMYSKNGVSMASLNIQYFPLRPTNPATGVGNSAMLCQALTIYDCFKFLIAYLTDLKVSFKSDLLDTSKSISRPVDRIKKLNLTTGYNLYYGGGGFTNTEPPKISLQRLITEISRFYQIGYYVEYDSNGNATFVLEDLDWFLNNTSVLSYTAVKSIEQKNATNVYYSNIQIGGNSSDYDENTYIYKFQEEETYTFGEEAYYFGGVCNIDKTLNLQGSFIVDHNTLQSTQFNTAQGVIDAFNTYRERIFLIETSLPCQVLSTVYLYDVTANTNNSYYHYNDNLLNSNVLRRFNNFGYIYFNTSTNVYTQINSSPKKYLKTLTFTKIISDSDYQLLKQNITGKIEVNVGQDGELISGWIKSFKRKLATGETTIELRTE